VTEGSTATVTLSLSAASALPVAVDYATRDGTALAGSDYTAKTGHITITPGLTSISFTVPTLQDTLDEVEETSFSR